MRIGGHVDDPIFGAPKSARDVPYVATVDEQTRKQAPNIEVVKARLVDV